MKTFEELLGQQKRSLDEQKKILASQKATYEKKMYDLQQQATRAKSQHEEGKRMLKVVQHSLAEVEDTAETERKEHQLALQDLQQ